MSWADPNDPERRVQNVPGGKWRFPCINSPRRGQIVAATREIVERYQPDAFCLDMYHANFGACVCRFCRPTVEKICGTKTLTMELLKKHWPQYIDWKLERSASLLDEITAILRPKGVVSLHNAGAPLPLPVTGGAGELWMPHLDVILLEAFSNLDLTTITARSARAFNKPGWQLLTSSHTRHAHLSIPPAWWRVTAATCKANNVAVLGPCGTRRLPRYHHLTGTSPQRYRRFRAFRKGRGFASWSAVASEGRPRLLLGESQIFPSHNDRRA